MKTSEDRRGMAGGVDLVALWETGDNLGGAPVFKGKAKPGANRWVRRAGALPMNWAAVAAGLMVLTLVPFLAQEGSRPPAANEGLGADGVLGVDPFVAEAGAGAMSPGFPSDGSDVVRAQDPSLMVLGPERPGIAAAAAPSSAPTAPAAKPAGATDWAAALKNAVRTAAPAAVKKAGLPSPSARLTGALKALAGGAGSSASKAVTSTGEALRLSAPSSKDLLSSFKAMDSLQLRRSEPLLRSMARGGSVPSSISQGGANFNSSARPSGGASASENLRDAVAAFGSPSANGQGGGGPAVFDGGRGPGANPAGAAKAPGESLEFQRRKMEMEKEMDLKYAKRKYNELGRQEMLDKVNAESAAKMKETIAGKVIDGAFGLAQKAMGGEGGGKGNEESASAANQEAKAARQRLDGSAASLGERGASRANVAQGLTSGGDRYLAPGMAPIVQGAATKAQLGFKSMGAASGQFAQLNAALDKANMNIVKANDATESLIQLEDKYIGGVQQRIGGWQLPGFKDMDVAGNMLETRIDAKGPLGNAANGESTAKHLLSAAQGAAGSSPSDMNSEVTRMQALTATVKEHAKLNRTLSLAPGEIGKDNAALTSTVADGQSMISAGAKAVQLTGGARKIAESTYTNAESVRDQLKAFENLADAKAMELQGLSATFDAQITAQDYAGANLTMIKFTAAKTPLQAQVTTLSQLTPPVHQQLGQARSKQ